MLLFAQDAQPGKRLQVGRGGLPLGDACVDYELDLGVRVPEDDLDQILAVDRRRFGLHPCAHTFHQGTNPLHLFMGLLRRRFDGAQHEQNPVLPVLRIGDAAQAFVVGGTVGDDVARQEQDRDVEQPLLDQIQQIQDAPGTAIAIRKRMDGLELVMHHRHLHQRVDAVLGMDELFEIAQLVADDGLADRWGIDHLTRFVLQRRTRNRPDAQFRLLDQADDLDEQIGRQRPCLQCLKAAIERFIFLSGRFLWLFDKDKFFRSRTWQRPYFLTQLGIVRKENTESSLLRTEVLLKF